MSPEKSERMPLANEALHTNDVMSNVRVDVNDADPLNTLRDVRDFVADPDGAAKAVRPADRGPPTAIALTADRVVCDMHSRCGAVRSRTRGNAVPATPFDRVARMYLAMASILSERQVRARALDRNRMVTLGSTSFAGVTGNGLANFKDSGGGLRRPPTRCPLRESSSRNGPAHNISPHRSRSWPTLVRDDSCLR